MPSKTESAPTETSTTKPPYPGVAITCNGNQLVAEYVEVRVTEGGVFLQSKVDQDVDSRLQVQTSFQYNGLRVV